MKVLVFLIVVFCYNEQEVFILCLNELLLVLNSMVDKGKIDVNSYIVFVDDGSKDLIWSLIKEEFNKNYKVKGVKFFCNKGYQIVLMVGLFFCINFDIIVSIDVDLQDDILVIEKMVDLYLFGYDIVYGVCNDRVLDSFFKKFMVEIFYKVMIKFGVSQVENYVDFRFLSKCVFDVLLQYRE